MATPVYPSMSPAPTDGLQPLYVKIAYYLQVAAEAGGAANSTMLLPSMSPQPNDGIQPLLVKIAYWASLVTGGGGGSTNNPVYTGAAPPAAPTFPLQGALFTPDDATQPLQAWTPGVGWHTI